MQLMRNLENNTAILLNYFQQSLKINQDKTEFIIFERNSLKPEKIILVIKI